MSSTSHFPPLLSPFPDPTSSGSAVKLDSQPKKKKKKEECIFMGGADQVTGVIKVERDVANPGVQILFLFILLFFSNLFIISFRGRFVSLLISSC